MKASQFNLFIPVHDDQTLIFNTFSDSRVIADKSVVEAIQTCHQPHLLNDKQRDQLHQLRELGIVVNANTDEQIELEYWFQRLKFDSSTISVNILTTLACNMRCVYCFEQGVHSNLSMGKRMAAKVCNWLADKLEEVRPKELIIIFFGGEPLLNSEAMKFISKTLYHESDQRGVALHIEIITNGLLLAPELVDALNPFGLRRVKVTLDGEEKCHDRMRPRKSSRGRDKDGRGTYQEIISNLLQVRGTVPITIGGNYDDTTKHHVPALLDDLKNRGFTSDEIVKIGFKPILAFPGHETQSSHRIEACTFSETNVDDIFWLVQEIEKRGFSPYKDIALGPCEARREHTYTIDPSGDIYKCASLAGRTEYVIGNILDDPAELSFSPNNLAFMTADPWRECDQCKFIPICAGGCRVGAMMENGDLRALCCEKDYFENVSKKLVASDV